MTTRTQVLIVYWSATHYAHSLDLFFWYDSAFGSPVARVQGIGYVQEMLARLTHTPIAVHNSSTNATLNDSPITFPLDHPLYVDATHEVVVLNSKIMCLTCFFITDYLLSVVITALNLTNFAADGPLPADHIPKHRSFKVSHLAPFSTNIQFQRKLLLVGLMGFLLNILDLSSLLLVGSRSTNSHHHK